MEPQPPGDAPRMLAHRGVGATRSPTPPLTDAEVGGAIAQLQAEGFCLLKNRIPREIALSIADELLDQHEAEHAAADNAASFQLLFGLFNTEPRTWEYMPAHPDVVKVAGAFLGAGQVRAIEGISGRTLPGATLGGLHKDCAQDFHTLPDTNCCWGINGIWMLTDFTAENGATKVVRRSHLETSEPPPGSQSWEETLGPDQAVPVLGEAGDVFLWHMGTLHQNGANVTVDETRVSFNCGYLPAWFNHRIMGGHQPMFPSEYEKMPPAVRDYLPRVTGYDRSDAYEYHAVPRPPMEREPWEEWADRTRSMLSDEPEAALSADEIAMAIATMEEDGYCVLDGRLGASAVTALGEQLGRHTSADQEGAVFGLMNVAEAAWGVVASQPEVVLIARHLIGPRVRVVDVGSLSPSSSAAGEGGTELGAHRSARCFEVAMPQAECPWLIEAVWALAEGGGEARLVPGSHRSRQPGLAADTQQLAPAAKVETVELPAGSVLLCHGGLWVHRDAQTSLPLLLSQHDGAAAASLHTLYGATWWNSWLEDDLQPLWPSTYEAMPVAVQALMPGLCAETRAEVYEPAFDFNELGYARYERRRQEAQGGGEPLQGDRTGVKREGVAEDEWSRL